LIKRYKETWLDDEWADIGNFHQQTNIELAKDEIRPKVFEELKRIVDEMIKVELQDLAA